MSEAKEEIPTWWPIQITAAPRIGNLYWCKFNKAELVPLPEMWKERPVIVVSHRDMRLKGSCLVIPTSTNSQDRNKWCIEVPKHIIDQIDGRQSWVLCSHLITISTSRLEQIKGKVLKLNQEHMNEIKKWLGLFEQFWFVL